MYQTQPQDRRTACYRPAPARGPAIQGWPAWRGLRSSSSGRTRVAVNVRLAPPEAVADLPIDHFDGLDTFDDLPRDGRCVRDLWF